jgi:L-iditol 2-dehydrogenase
MRAAFLTGIGRIEIRPTPDPHLTRAGDVLLEVAAVGVCGSDAHYFRVGGIGSQVVSFPWVVGHECAGKVVEVGADVKHLKPGQRVAVDPLISCGQCDQCRAGREHTCRNQKFLGYPGQSPGALSEYLVMPAKCCYALPDSMSVAEAVMVEPFAIGLYAQRMARAHPGAKIAILGSGPIGLCVLLALRAAGEYTIYATDLVDERLEVARRCGADWVGNPRREDIVATLSRLEPLGMGFVFECAGQQETLDQGVELLKPGGTLLIVGIPELERVSFSISQLRRKELRLENVRRQNQCTAPAIELVARGTVNVEQLVTHHFPLAETQKAFELAAGYREGVVKALIHLPLASQRGSVPDGTRGD